MIDIAIKAAREAGSVLQDYARRGFQIENKGRINLVTEADIAAEKHIIDIIKSNYPSHRILAEESGAVDLSELAVDSDYCWVIDPLDGTTNFSHGLPVYAVSIGIEYKGSIIAGAIFDPSLNEMYAAERGAGATLNGNKIRVSEIDKLERALLVTGFPYDIKERLDDYLPTLGAFLSHAQGIRRLGAAAIDMCYVACGRLDAFWEDGLKPWDSAAGWVIVEEAGGQITNLDGSAYDNYKGRLLCTNGKIHDEMLAVLRGLSN